METWNKISPGQRLVRLLKPDSREVRNVYIYAIFSGLVSLSLPLGIQAIINLIQGGNINASWIVLVVLVVAGVAMNGILQIIQLRITENLQQNIFTRSAFEFAYRIPRIKLEVLYQHYAPELMNRFFDTISVQKGLSKILIEFSSAALSVIFGLILLSFYHPFFIVFSIILLVLILAIFHFTANRGMTTSLKESKNKYRIAHWLEEIARTGTTFKLAGITELSLHRTDSLVMDYLKSREGHFKVLIQQYSLLVVFKVMVATGLLAIGGILVMEQLMNIGQFVAAEIIILLVMSSVEKLVMSLETIYDVLTSLEKIGSVTDMQLESAKGDKLLESDKGLSIDMENVLFAYPGAILPVLTGFDLKIKAGEKIVISGESGAGRSSLLHVLAALYEVQKGSVCYDGVPKADIELNSLRSVIGDFMAHEQIFEGTVKENITIGRPDVGPTDLQWAVEMVGLSDDFKANDLGFGTMLQPLGQKIPKSTALKVLLARAIANRPRLLLVEGNFDFLHEKERKKLIKFLTSKENPWTLVATSNDLEWFKNADRVLHLNDGKLKINDFNSKSS